jgi:hypothetical protein
MVAKSDIKLNMNRSHRKTLNTVFADPVSGNKTTFHRPHPGKDALRYQVRAARDFLKIIGVTQ